MNTLYTKLFLGFWSAMLAVAGALLLAQHLWPAADGLPSAARMQEHSAELQRLAEEEGFPGVAGYLRALNRGEEAQLVLITERSRFLPARRLDPELRRALQQLAAEPTAGHHRIGNLNARTHPVTFPGGRATLIALAPDRGLRDMPWWSHVLVALLVTALFSLALARWLSAPVRRVRAASHRLAEGMLDTRVPETGHGGDDISALAHDFNRMAERLQTLLESRNELLRDISHELRSPLARLQVALELARKDSAGAALDRMEREIERMDMMISELLALSRLEAGTLPLAQEPVELDLLLRGLCTDARFEASSSGREVVLESEGPVTVEGDAGLLQSAFDNILRNAVRYTHAGTAVRVMLATRDGQAEVTVSDHGPGVPNGDLDRIFEPFMRASSARERETGGHGLGLSIARRAVLLHDGSIRAFNRPEGGLSVSVRLPLSRAPSA